MDLQQNKLTKSEWESIEIPSTPEEKNIYKQFSKDFLTPKCSECFFSPEFNSQLV